MRFDIHPGGTAYTPSPRHEALVSTRGYNREIQAGHPKPEIDDWEWTRGDIQVFPRFEYVGTPRSHHGDAVHRASVPAPLPAPVPSSSHVAADDVWGHVRDRED